MMGASGAWRLSEDAARMTLVMAARAFAPPIERSMGPTETRHPMNPIRRFAWIIAMAGIAAGCGEEEGAAPSPQQGNPTTASPSLAPKQPIIPPSSAEDKDKAPRGEPGKAEGPADKEHSPKDTEPAPPTARPADSKKGDESPKLEPPKGEGAAPKADTAAAAKLGPEEMANIKKLPPADQELAMKQVFCPVQDGKLGEMGKPFKVIVEGRTVFLCCDGCEKDLKADPKKFFAKLDAKSGTR